jgi:hypothetical protein
MENGVYLYYQNPNNFYYLTLSNTAVGVLSGAASWENGALYRVVSGAATLVGNLAALNVDHTYDYNLNHYTITTSFTAGQLHVSVTKEKLFGDSSTVSAQFVDAAPAFTSGNFGFYHAYQQWNHMSVDDIRLDTPERPDTTWYDPSAIRREANGCNLPAQFGLIVYPNPSATAVVIRSDRAVNTLRIYTLAGRLVKTQEVKTGVVLYLDRVDGLKSGIYLLEANGHQQFKKIVLLKP